MKTTTEINNETGDLISVAKGADIKQEKKIKKQIQFLKGCEGVVHSGITSDSAASMLKDVIRKMKNIDEAYPMWISNYTGKIPKNPRSKYNSEMEYKKLMLQKRTLKYVLSK